MQGTRRTVTMRSCAVLVALGVSLVCGAPAPASASPIVLAGHDVFTTLAGAQQDFSSFPLPADLFFPGSDPFAGVVALQGEPLVTWDGHSGLGTTDTIVRRLTDAVPPGNPPPDQIAPTIDVEIVALSLRSVGLFTVTSGGGNDFYDLSLNIDTTALTLTTPSLGTKDITQTSATGGIYNSHLEVFPQFTFTWVSGPGAPRPTVSFDMFGLTGSPTLPAAVLNTVNNPTWEYTSTHNQLVVPGLTGPNFYIFGQILNDGPLPIQATVVPELSTLALLALGMLGLLGYGSRRKRAA